MQKKKQEGRDQETNTVQGKAECCIRFENMPEYYFLHIA